MGLGPIGDMEDGSWARKRNGRDKANRVPHRKTVWKEGERRNINTAVEGGERRLVNDRLETTGRADTYQCEHTLHKASERPPYFRWGLARQFLEGPTSEVGALSIFFIL
ncbi:unnamed protein product [Citrullus colocynthis]|uniref:Uncharacterized protein n=1 Tax=Citrullus colocynthis TaxID=252529 RepID=A0ABP0YDM7_9ROSI